MLVGVEPRSSQHKLFQYVIVRGERPILSRATLLTIPIPWTSSKCTMTELLTKSELFLIICILFQILPCSPALLRLLGVKMEKKSLIKIEHAISEVPLAADKDRLSPLNLCWRISDILCTLSELSCESGRITLPQNY